MPTVNGWGRLPHTQCPAIQLLRGQAKWQIQQTGTAGIAYGMGRSYGDEALNRSGISWITTGFGRLTAFNSETRILSCEAGVTLQDIQHTFLPQGFMLPVTPGTQLITVGGAIANDVHGKNHHRFGSFGHHVEAFTLLRTDGSILNCSRENNSGYFHATIGGMGLTGIILQAELQLRSMYSPWINAVNLPFYNLDEFFALSKTAETDWEHTVSWVDCLNGRNLRGVLICGNPVAAYPGTGLPKKHNTTFPFTPPFSPVNKLTLSLFNRLYFHLQKRKQQPQTVYYEPFFYPLDAIRNWNRLYGPKGFYQYQCVLPKETGRDAVAEMVAQIKKSGSGSFLAVLKTFGKRESDGLLSFPLPGGVTLALDFPNRSDKTLSLFERLDAVTAATGGRLYTAKDARMPRALFESGYPEFEKFSAFRDPGIASDMSRRLFGN